MVNIETNFLIVGGGPTGLGSASCLQQHGIKDFLLIEEKDHFGGLSASFQDSQGFTWDLGGHVLFSHYPTFDHYMDLALGKEGWLEHERESWIWIKNRFVPYPFQLNLHRLDPADRDRCLAGLEQASTLQFSGFRSQISSFRDWILSTFGQGIAELFMLPYNFKVWAYPAEQMGHQWIAERVAVPDMAQIKHAIQTGEDQISWGPNKTFRFPHHGGTGAIWAALGGNIHPHQVVLGDPVVEIDPDAHTAITGAGRKIHYQHMISSMPLDHLASMAGMEIKDGAKLIFSSVYVIGVGLEAPPPEVLRSKCWMYFSEKNSPYYRVTVFSNYSPQNVPEPRAQWSLMAEVSESPAKPVSESDLLQKVLHALHEDALIPDLGRICSTVVRRIPQAYPTPFLGRDQIVTPLLRELESRGIYSRGRFGAWRYEVGNMDHSFMQGFECASRLIEGGCLEMEPTLLSCCQSESCCDRQV